METIKIDYITGSSANEFCKQMQIYYVFNNNSRLY